MNKRLYRKNDPITSRLAAESINVTTLEEKVLRAIKTFGKDGCISDEVRAYFENEGLAYSSVTARYKNLADMKLIVRGPDKRKGKSNKKQLVMRSSENCDHS